MSETQIEDRAMEPVGEPSPRMGGAPPAAFEEALATAHAAIGGARGTRPRAAREGGLETARCGERALSLHGDVALPHGAGAQAPGRIAEAADRRGTGGDRVVPCIGLGVSSSGGAPGVSSNRREALAQEGAVPTAPGEREPATPSLPGVSRRMEAAGAEAASGPGRTDGADARIDLAAAPPAPEPSTADWSRALEAGGGEATVQLSFPQASSLVSAVEISSDADGELSVNVQAEPGARPAVDRALEELRRRLAGQGLEVRDITLASRQEGI